MPKWSPVYRDLRRLARRRGIKVDAFDIGEKVRKSDPVNGLRVLSYLGGLYRGAHNGEPPWIWLNPRFTEQPREWLLAHELAHHMDKRDTAAVSLSNYLANYANDPLEGRADRFADKLVALMERKHGRVMTG